MMPAKNRPSSSMGASSRKDIQRKSKKSVNRANVPTVLSASSKLSTDQATDQVCRDIANPQHTPSTTLRHPSNTVNRHWMPRLPRQLAGFLSDIRDTVAPLRKLVASAPDTVVHIVQTHPPMQILHVVLDLHG